MSWVLRFHPAVKKDLRRVTRQTRDFIIDEVLPKIVRDPRCGEPLHGPLKGMWKVYVGEYRIAYMFREERSEIVVLEIGPRGGFYERLRRRLGK